MMIRRGLVMSLPFLAAIWIMSVLVWTQVEPGQQFPVHWGMDGQPDRYGGVFEAFFFIPSLLTGLVALFCVLPLIDPRGQNLRRSSTAYLSTWIAVLALMTVIHGTVLLTATGRLANDGADVVLPLTGGGIGILLMIVGNVLGKARPNWFFGIRTPWTLSSDLSWDKTHRLTGKLMVLGGLAMTAGVFLLPPEYAVVVILAGSLIPAVIGVVYSFLVWKSDPTRETVSPSDE